MLSARIGSIVCVVTILVAGPSSIAAEEIPIQPRLRLTAPTSQDQDDLCVWVHPTAPERSRIITSDKKANALFVYDLTGKLVEEHPAVKPGNIDIRQSVSLGGEPSDIVVVNQRGQGFRLLVFRVDGEGALQRIDGGLALTAPNYGGCLFHNPKTRKLSFLCTAEDGLVQQYELEGVPGGVKTNVVREVPLGKCEGAVADDEMGSLYISIEQQGIWKMAADASESTAGEFIVRVGEQGVLGDLEGLAIYRTGPGTGYLLVSDQGLNRYRVFDRAAPHRSMGDFGIDGAEKTDGIEAVATPLGPDFPGGLFACHTDLVPRPMLISSWKDVEAALVPSQPALR